MKRTIIQCITICFFMLGLPSVATTKPIEIDPYDAAVIHYTQAPILYISIKSVSRDKFTNGNPPKLNIRTEGVMRGNRVPIKMDAVWNPMPADYGWAGEHATALMKKWSETPLAAPKVKSKWYVTGTLKDGIFHISPLLRLKNRSRLSNTLSPLITASDANPQNYSLAKVEKEIAALKNLELWRKELATSDMQTLLKKADVIVRAGIQEIDTDKKSVRFYVIQTMKRPLESPAPETIKLAGFPSALFAHIYYLNQIAEARRPDLLIFLKESTHTTADGTNIIVHNPISKTESIQPVDNKKMEALSRLIPTS